MESILCFLSDSDRTCPEPDPTRCARRMLPVGSSLLFSCKTLAVIFDLGGISDPNSSLLPPIYLLLGFGFISISWFFFRFLIHIVLWLPFSLELKWFDGSDLVLDMVLFLQVFDFVLRHGFPCGAFQSPQGLVLVRLSVFPNSKPSSACSILITCYYFARVCTVYEYKLRIMQ